MVKFIVEFAKNSEAPAVDGRLDGPAYHRNHEPIWSAISGFLSALSGDVLEIGSGTGQHATEFARRTPQLNWWPSDIYDSHLKSIAAWRAHSGLVNLRAPQRIDPPLEKGKRPGDPGDTPGDAPSTPGWGSAPGPFSMTSERAPVFPSI